MDPQFFAQVRHRFEESIPALHGHLQFLDPDEFAVVDAVSNYKETSRAPELSYGGLPQRTFMFPHFKYLDYVVDTLERELLEVIAVIPGYKSRPWWPKLKPW